jgi:peptide/nickel transport system permease protein
MLAETPVPTTESASSRRTLGVGAWVCVGWLVLLVIVALVGPSLAAAPLSTGNPVTDACGSGDGLPIYDPISCSDLKAKSEQARPDGPTTSQFTHLLGVDRGGRDTLSQVLIGTRMTLFIALVSISLATLIGGALGLIGGYYGGKVGALISGVFDVMIAFPALILALLVVTFYAAEDPSRRVPGIILALVVVATPILGRIARAATISWSTREFVTAARAVGAKSGRILIREVLPNVAPAMMSIAMLGIGIVIVTEASLSVIGLGVPADTVSWGSVTGAGAADFRHYSHLVFVPGVVILVTVSTLNFLGDALRRKFDVRESVL